MAVKWVNRKNRWPWHDDKTSKEEETENPPVMMTRWSEVKEVLSDSSIRDIPEIANEDFVNHEIVNNEIFNNEIVNTENVNKEIVKGINIVNDGYLREETLDDKETIERTAEEEEVVDGKDLTNDEVTLTIVT